MARRLAPEEYLGLHLTIGLLFCLSLLGIFSLIAHGVEDGAGLTRWDEEVDLGLHEFRETHPGVRSLFLGITQLGSVPAMTIVGLGVALWLLMQRRHLLPLVCLITLAGGGLLDAGLKLVFERDRPPFRDPAVVETTKSFPSGHSVGSAVGYGFLAYVGVRSLRSLWARVTLVAALAVLVALIGFSRIFLGAHYLSDVLGGYAVGGAWLAASISGLEVVRRRKVAHEEAEKRMG
jgi:undecaprenyl-diphosphatase